MTVSKTFAGSGFNVFVLLMINVAWERVGDWPNGMVFKVHLIGGLLARKQAYE